MVKVTVIRGSVHAGGRQLYLPGDSFETSEKGAKRLIDKGVAREAHEDGVITRSDDPADLTVPQLKELLDKLEIEYPKKVKKAELLDLLATNTAEPPAELAAAMQMAKDQGALNDDGKPEIKFLESILEREISEAERDEAWEEFNPAPPDASNAGEGQE